MAKQCINEILTENIPHGSRHTTAMVHKMWAYCLITCPSNHLKLTPNPVNKGHFQTDNIGLTNGWIEVLKTILNKKCLQFWWNQRPIRLSMLKGGHCESYGDMSFEYTNRRDYCLGPSPTLYVIHLFIPFYDYFPIWTRPFLESLNARTLLMQHIEAVICLYLFRRPQI